MGKRIVFEKPHLDVIAKLESKINLLQIELDKYKWISIDEDLPIDGQKVLATDKFNVFTAYFFKHKICNWEDDYGEQLYVTHWMSLPEPPKESECLPAKNVDDQEWNDE